jgi:hypothetical protein
VKGELTMTDPGFDRDAEEADVVEQMIPVEVSDDDPDLAAARTTISRDHDGSEADLLDQAIAVPLTDDEPDVDR